MTRDKHELSPKMHRAHQWLQPWRMLISPVIYGVDNIPDERPLMFIGNHTMYGILDVPLLVTALHKRTGIVLRGLGDGLHFKVPGWRQLVRQHGVVLASPENCSQLLQAGECVLVFPGGAREVAKRKGERYQLVWKERLGFARLAIQHGCTIVPVSSVGVDDAFDIWRDGDEIANSPVGRILERLGTRRDAIWPIAKRFRPERMYFKFGQPISTRQYAGLPDQLESCKDLRARVEAAINTDIRGLLHTRDQDPGRSVPTRLRQRAKRIARGASFASKLLRRTRVLETLSPSGLAAFARRLPSAKLGAHTPLILHACNKPEQLAVADYQRRLSWAKLNDEVSRVAHGLASRGVQPGDRVALMLHNCVEYVVVQQALMRLGAVAVQVGYRLKRDEIAHVFTDAEPRAIVFDEAFGEQVNAAQQLAGVPARDMLISVGERQPLRPEHTRYSGLLAHEPATAADTRGANSAGVMIYTSGTTGKPKGATRRVSKTGLASLGDFIVKVGMNAHERHLVVCPLYHSGSYGFFSMVSALGGSSFLVDHFDPARVLEAIERERITSAFMVPTMLARLADAAAENKYDTSSLKWIGSGAAPLPTATADRFQAQFGRLLWNFYGATETGLITLAGPADHAARPGTVGRLLRGNKVRFIGPDGCDVAVGEIGELYVKNAMLIGGYYGNPDATSAAMRDGYFSVGDLARMDSDGYLYIESRKHDMVISGGVNIYPREIEDHLCSHPGILECAVVGIADDTWGETVKAFIVRRPGATLTADDVATYCKQGLADYKRPRQVAFVDSLPRNPTGKVLKNQLREPDGRRP